jgi:hypothetical protein
MSPDYRDKIVLLQKFVRGVDPEEPAASSHLVASPTAIKVPMIVLYWITPQNVAK